jgi:hypothetical protein
MQLSAQEDVTEFCRHDSFKTHSFNDVIQSLMHTNNKLVKKVNRNLKKSIVWHSVTELHSNDCIKGGKQCLFFDQYNVRQ